MTHTTKPTLPDQQAVVTFWGAAQMVTGSMHLLETGNRKILLDCGLYQGKRDESHRKNASFPFPPEEIDAVLISHAHIDHCGNLPTLIHQGFRGPIYCTPATRDLLQVMLTDSAKIQEEDAAHLNMQRKANEPYVQPLYSIHDVDQVLYQCVGVRFGKQQELTKHVSFRFLEAGHVLGSAMVQLDVDGHDREHTVVFTGDLGRRNLPMLKPTAPIPPCSVLVCESTYGNRIHERVEKTVEKLYEAIRRTIDREGKVLIPAFSLGRTQLVVHFLQQGVRKGLIPKVPIYVDSPLASGIAEVYRRHPDCLSDEVASHLDDGTGILGGNSVEYIRNFEDSVQISLDRKPMIIVASSGMCDAGRILHHLKQHVDDPRCTVILVSYQAYGTTGRRLLEKQPTVRFLGRDWNKWIEVVHLDGFSGHADREDFDAFLKPVAGKIDRVRLIHGEREQAEALKSSLRDMGFRDVEVPQPGDTVRVG